MRERNDMEKKGSLAETLSHLRKKKGLSQAELAERLHVNQASVSRWEKGAGAPSADILQKLSEILEINASALLSGKAAVFDGQSALPIREPVVILVEDIRVVFNDFMSILSTTLINARCYGFQRASEALKFASSHDVDVAFLDIELFDSDGITLANKLRGRFPQINIIYLTAHPEYAMDAHSSFCSGYLLKPLTPNKIREQVAHLRFPVWGLSG